MQHHLMEVITEVVFMAQGKRVEVSVAQRTTLAALEGGRVVA